MDNRIGAQLYTVRDYCKTLDDFDASMKKISEIGYKTVQLSGIGDFLGTDVKRILDKYSLEAICTHRGWENYVNKLDSEIEYHRETGCKICGLGSMPGFNTEPETISNFLNNFNPVAEKLEKENLIFAYHNHAFEFAKIDGKYVFDILTEGMKTDNFKLILDVYWLAIAGIDPAKFIREHSGRIACVHIKDLKVVNNGAVFSSVGEGNLDWDNIIDACKTSNVGYAFVEQDDCRGEDPFECLARSYEFLSGKGFN